MCYPFWVTLILENAEYSVFSLQTVSFTAFWWDYSENLGYSLKLTQILGNCSQMLANAIEFSKNSGNSGQNVQYFSQMATLFVVFPKYSGHSNQFATSSWDFSEKLWNSYQNTSQFCSQLYKLQISGVLLAPKNNANTYKCV